MMNFRLWLETIETEDEFWADFKQKNPAVRLKSPEAFAAWKAWKNEPIENPVTGEMEKRFAVNYQVPVSQKFTPQQINTMRQNLKTMGKGNDELTQDLTQDFART